MSRQSGRAVSPVVAVILMVAVTVILSAVIGTFVLNLGQGLDGETSRNIGVRSEADGSKITFTVITGEADSLILLINGTEESNISNVTPGDSLSTTATKHDDVTVVAVMEGSREVISTSNPLSGTGSGASGPVAPTDGLVAYYKFESGSGTTAIDSINGYNGSFMNETGWTSNSQVGSYALTLDGTDDWVSVGDAVIPSSGSFTVSVWAYGDSAYVGSLKETLSQDTGTSGGSGADFYIGWDGSSSHEIRVGDDWLSTGVQFPTDRWTHIVVVKTSSNTHLYVDGSLKASKGSAITNPSSDFRIARQFGSYGEYWGGKLDDIRVYNRSLNSSEVSDLYNATK